MKLIAAAKFKEQCLSILDRVDDEGIVITKRGRPVAKLIPIRAESATLIGSLKGKLKIKGDLFTTGLKWDAKS
jgi:prevent-host-death family protein